MTLGARGSSAVVLAGIVLGGCASQPVAEPAAPAKVITQESAVKTNGHRTPGADAVTPSKYDTEASKPIRPDPKTVAKARRLARQGHKYYEKGEYDAAEEAFKEALALHPFVAEANLGLGKVFLIRGSATRDRALLNSARLMFEMAQAVDPKLREAEMLLELVRETQTE